MLTHTLRHTDRQADIHIPTHTHTLADTNKDTDTHTHTCTQSWRQRHTDTQTHRPTHLHPHTDIRTIRVLLSTFVGACGGATGLRDCG